MTHNQNPEFFLYNGTINPEYNGTQPTLTQVVEKLATLGVHIEIHGERFWWTTGRQVAGKTENITYPLLNTPQVKLQSGLSILAGFAAAERFHNINPSVVRCHNLDGD